MNRKAINIEIIKLKRASRKNRSMDENGESAAYSNMPLSIWHIFPDAFADEKADRSLQAYELKHQGQWLLINHKIKGMRSPGGNIVPPGKAFLRHDRGSFRISDQTNGYH